MTLLDFRSFGDKSINTAQPQNWGTNGNSIGYLAGRFANTWAASSSGNGLIYYTPQTPIATRIFAGFAYKFADHAQPEFVRVNTTTGVFKITPFDVTDQATIQWIVGGVTKATSTLKVRKGIWYSIELMLETGVGGDFELKVDGTVFITGNNGANSVGATIGNIGWSYSSNQTGAVTDIYICDDVGAAPYNGYLGDVRCDYLPPSSTFDAQLMGSDGNMVDNHLLVDEVPASVSDYVSSSVSDAYDVYRLTDTPVTIDKVILGVKGIVTGFKSDAGLATTRVSIGLGGAPVLSGILTLSPTPQTISTRPFTEVDFGGPIPVVDFNTDGAIWVETNPTP